MTIIVCLGPTPDTWWQARGVIAERVLDHAEELAADADDRKAPDDRKAIFLGKIFQTLNLDEIEALEDTGLASSRGGCPASLAGDARGGGMAAHMD